VIRSRQTGGNCSAEGKAPAAEPIGSRHIAETG
jgi:hypothetical protein